MNTKQVAEWLREAADCFDMIGVEFVGQATLAKYAYKLRQLATQVESTTLLNTRNPDPAKDELVEALKITIGTLKEICYEKAIPAPVSTIRRAEAALKKAGVQD